MHNTLIKKYLFLSINNFLKNQAMKFLQTHQIQSLFSDEKKLLRFRYLSSEAMMFLSGWLFFVNYFFVMMYFFEKFFLKTLIFLYITFEISLLCFLYYAMILYVFEKNTLILRIILIIVLAWMGFFFSIPLF